MTQEEIIELANLRYKDEDKVIPLEGSYMGLDGKPYQKSDAGFRIPPIRKHASFYDPKADTFAVWGRGIGLIYRGGVWAVKEGEFSQVPVINNSYSIT